MHDNSSPSPTEQRPASFTEERLLGVDLVRFLSFYAILFFHLTYALWARDGHTDVVHARPWMYPFEIYARLFAFSGFTIVGLSFFLFGLRPSTKSKYLWLLLLGFLAVWTWTTEEITDAWDIYQFLLAAILAVALAKFLRLPPRALAFVSFVGVSIPFWNLEPTANFALEAAVWGHCLTPGPGADWPLLPWIFYPLLTYAVGRLVSDQRADFRVLNRGERIAWLIALASTLPFLGSYYVTPLGLKFGCYVFRRPPIEFWAHQAWIWFAVRLSLTAAAQTRLDRLALAHWVSRRMVNRRFFAVYFVHFPLVFLVAAISRRFGFAYTPWAYIGGLIVIVSLLESPALFRLKR